MSRARKKLPFYKKKVWLWTLGGILGVIVFILVLSRLTPWPGAMLIRVVFNKGGHKTLQALEAHQPDIPVKIVVDQHYRANDKDAFLDVYFPERISQTKEQLPVIIWTHGGAWLSGNKKDAGPYFKLLAARGYTVVAPNYSLAPNHTYPTAVHQLNDLYAYIQLNAAQLHIDPSKILLAGDSAGSQLSSQMAAIITNPSYAQEMAITPAITPAQLRGVILNCGIYQMRGLTQPDPTLPQIVGWGDDVSVWAYSGTKDFSDPVIQQMSAYYHVTNNFPATYISGGNGDPLTKAQSEPFAAKLESLGVPVTKLFYANDHQPSLPHEYQFNLDNSDGKGALDATLDFIKTRTQ